MNIKQHWKTNIIKTRIEKTSKNSKIKKIKKKSLYSRRNFEFIRNERYGTYRIKKYPQPEKEKENILSK